METILFIVCAIGVVASSLGVIIAQRPMYNLFWMLVVFTFLFPLFVLQTASLLAVMNLLVYAGAILVLFLFVIMLLNLKAFDTPSPLITQGIFGLVGGVILGVQVFVAIKMAKGITPAGDVTSAKLYEMGNMESVAHLLISHYIYPFEVISVFLLAAMVGVIALLKRKDRVIGEPES